MSVNNHPSDRFFHLSLAALTVAGAVSLWPHVAEGQALSMNDVYGRGVHAYFANQTGQADELLSQVIEAGSTDPRVYYFRAMARLRSGRQNEAAHDMQLGAAYEARDPGAAGAVGQALMRIQGADRHLLERYRRQGRLLRAKEMSQLSRARYEQLQNRETEVLRRETPMGLDQLAAPSAAAPAAGATPAAPQLAPPAAGPPTPQPALTDEPAAAGTPAAGGVAEPTPIPDNADPFAPTPAPVAGGAAAGAAAAAGVEVDVNVDGDLGVESIEPTPDLTESAAAAEDDATAVPAPAGEDDPFTSDPDETAPQSLDDDGQPLGEQPDAAAEATGQTDDNSDPFSAGPDETAPQSLDDDGQPLGEQPDAAAEATGQADDNSDPFSAGPDETAPQSLDEDGAPLGEQPDAAAEATGQSDDSDPFATGDTAPQSDSEDTAPTSDADDTAPFSADESGAVTGEQPDAAADEPVTEGAASDADPFAPAGATTPPEGEFGEAADAPPASGAAAGGRTMGGLLGRMFGRAVSNMAPLPPDALRGMAPRFGPPGQRPQAAPIQPPPAEPGNAAADADPFSAGSDADAFSEPPAADQGEMPEAIPPQDPAAAEDDPFAVPAEDAAADAAPADDMPAEDAGAATEAGGAAAEADPFAQ